VEFRKSHLVQALQISDSGLGLQSGRRVYGYLSPAAKLGPEHIAVMTEAFEDVYRELGLAEREDPLRDIVARAIIACAQNGEREAVRFAAVCSRGN